MRVSTRLQACPSEPSSRVSSCLYNMDQAQAGPSQTNSNPWNGMEANHQPQGLNNEPIPNTPTGMGKGKMPPPTPFNSPSSSISEMYQGAEFEPNFGHSPGFPVLFPNKDQAPKDYLYSFEYIIYLSSQLVKSQSAYIDLLCKMIDQNTEVGKRGPQVVRQPTAAEKRKANHVCGPVCGRRTRNQNPFLNS